MNNPTDNSCDEDSNGQQNNVVIPKPYDSFFRSAMQNKVVAIEFLNKELPTKLTNALDLKTLQQKDTNYIDSSLQTSFSDICFECHYDQTFLQQQDINDSNVPNLKIIILVEHQSSPDKFMPFRMIHYLVNALFKELQSGDKTTLEQGLPVVYPLIYYHGEQSIESMPKNFIDCFFDPLNMMIEVLTRDIPLINISECSDEEILNNPLLAILNGFLKHAKKSQNENYHGLDIFLPKLLAVINQIDFSNPMTLEYLRSGLNFIFAVGNINNVNEIIQQSEQLPKSPRGEIMTIAEQLIQRGREESAQALREAEAKSAQAQAEKHQIAVNLLRSGLSIEFVAQNTQIDIETLSQLLKDDSQQH